MYARMKHAATAVWAAWSVLTILQALLSFFLYNQEGVESVRYLAWAVWVVMCIFAIVPIFTLRRKGGVPDGKGYVHTTALVDTGVYAVVRHPQYLSFMLLNLFLILVAQHWLITLMGLPAMALSYLIALDADQLGVERFGEEYTRYMQTVPRINLVLGLIRLLRRGTTDGSSKHAQESRVEDA